MGYKREAAAAQGKAVKNRLPKDYLVSVFLVLCVSIQMCQGYADLDTTAPLLSNAVSEFCGNGTCINFPINDISLTVNEQLNVSVNIDTANQTKYIDIFFKSGPQIQIVPNISDQVITAHPEEFHFEITSLNVGHTILQVYVTPSNASMNVSEGFLTLNIRHSVAWDYISGIVGWAYFVAWSVSFYPQIILNFKRKSVIGLHFDFLSLNTIGFLLYTIFNMGLYLVPSVRKEYADIHPYGLNPVQLNDVVFSIHAFIACIILVIQCMIYDRGEQKISRTGRSVIGGISIAVIVTCVLTATNVLTWLKYLYFLSYIKLFITVIKYIPQAYYNYLRKSTSGWSIGNILLDCTGGTLSICQMFILSYNYSDWESIFGDPTKFGLGLISILFDILFMIQHYVLYREYISYGSVNEDAVLSHESASSPLVQSGQGSVYGSMSNR